MDFSSVQSSKPKSGVKSEKNKNNFNPRHHPATGNQDFLLEMKALATLTDSINDGRIKCTPLSHTTWPNSKPPALPFLKVQRGRIF